MQRSVLYLAAMALLCGGVGKAEAGFVIDQSSTGALVEGFNASSSLNLPLGQEFKPTLSSLNFVDLVLGDAGSDVGPGASFQVEIHAGTITGTLLGTSGTVSLPDNFNLAGGSETYTHFTFASPVALTPGSTEVIKIVQLSPIVSGNDNFLMYGDSESGADKYTAGKAIIGGSQPFSTFDFNFREGTALPDIVTPEPSSLTLLGFGLAGLIGYGTRRRKA